MIEIRNYHFDPELFDEYKPWAKSLALPYLRKKMDLIGFWVTNDEPVELKGSRVPDDMTPPSNITWAIRWEDKAQHDRVHAEWNADPEWSELMSKVPGGRASYHIVEVKFADEL